jgi:hypothetical protein
VPGKFRKEPLRVARPSAPGQASALNFQK